MYINHNQMATNVANTLTDHYSNLQTSTQRLSSGLRINSAADDAAGLAIRELMRTDVAALQQGVRNANDAISLIQTADGALGVIDEKLTRMKELAEQAATGTYDSTQRPDRLGVPGHGRKLPESPMPRTSTASTCLTATCPATHDGSDLTATGQDEDPLRDHERLGRGLLLHPDRHEHGLGSGCGQQRRRRQLAYTVSTQNAAQSALVGINDAVVSKDAIRAHLGALQNRLENTISNLTTQGRKPAGGGIAHFRCGRGHGNDAVCP